MLRRRPRSRHAAQRLRIAVEAMPRRSREGMLKGIEQNTIIAGAYTDPSNGGVCPMLAAHRNGGRTSLASFARSWDRYTGARRPRLATERELRVLRSYLELSLVAEDAPDSGRSLAHIARDLRAEREELRRAETRRSPAADADAPAERARPDTGERHRARELRRGRFWSWIIPARSIESYRERIAAASEQVNEQRAAELLDAETAAETGAAPADHHTAQVHSLN